jgi:hypothetical protein
MNAPALMTDKIPFDVDPHQTRWCAVFFQMALEVQSLQHPRCPVEVALELRTAGWSVSLHTTQERQYVQEHHSRVGSLDECIGESVPQRQLRPYDPRDLDDRVCKIRKSP